MASEVEVSEVVGCHHKSSDTRCCYPSPSHAPPSPHTHTYPKTTAQAYVPLMSPKFPFGGSSARQLLSTATAPGPARHAENAGFVLHVEREVGWVLRVICGSGRGGGLVVMVVAVAVVMAVVVGVAVVGVAVVVVVVVAMAAVKKKKKKKRKTESTSQRPLLIIT